MNENRKNNFLMFIAVALSVALLSMLIFFRILPVRAAVPEPPFTDPEPFYGVLLESMNDPDFVYQVSGRTFGISLWEDGIKHYFSWGLTNHSTLEALASYDGGQTYPYTLTLTQPDISNFKVINGVLCAAYSGYDFITVSEDNSIYSGLLPMSTLDVHPEYGYRLYFEGYVKETGEDGDHLYPTVFCLLSKESAAITQYQSSIDSFHVYSTSESILYYYDETEDSWEIAVQSSDGINTITLTYTNFGLRNSIKWLNLLSVIRGSFSFRHFSHYYNGNPTDTSTGFTNNGLAIRASFFANEADKLEYPAEPTPTPDTPEPEPGNIVLAYQYNASFFAGGTQMPYVAIYDITYTPGTLSFSDSDDVVYSDLVSSVSGLRTGFSNPVFTYYDSPTQSFLYLPVSGYYVDSIDAYMIPYESFNSSWTIEEIRELYDPIDSQYSFESNNMYSVSGVAETVFCYRPYVGTYSSWAYMYGPISVIDSLTSDNIVIAPRDTAWASLGKFDTNLGTVDYPNVPWYIGLLYGLGVDVEPEPTTEPEPTATPTPSPTGEPGSADNPIYVTSVPDGPSPTGIDWTSDPANPGGGGAGPGQGSGPGSSDGLGTGVGGYIDSEGVGSVLGEGSGFLATWGTAAGLFAAVFNFIPQEIRFFAWFAVFLGLLAGLIKVILHFGGGN